MLKIEYRAMGCGMSAFIDDDSEQAARALEQAPDWFEEWEQVLSRFRPDSELNQLNASGGRPFIVSQILWDVIVKAVDAARWTGGLVVPTVLKSLEAAGYDRSFENIQTESAWHPGDQCAGPLNRSVEPASWQQIQMDAYHHSICLPENTRLDLGGVAKGWAAHQAARRLSAYGPALMDAGGDISVSGTASNGQPWPVGVADPLQVQENLSVLALGNCGVATSGIDYRRWQHDGVWKHHIIDPRTGEPALTDLMSVTVVAPDVLQAEAAAKMVLILGSQAGLDWLEDQSGLAGLLSFPDGRVILSSLMHSYTWRSYVI